MLLTGRVRLQADLNALVIRANGKIEDLGNLGKRKPF